MNYLRPDISKGITTLVRVSVMQLDVCIIYDLTYQKGLRLDTICPIDIFYFGVLSTTWHIKRDYDFKRKLPFFVAIPNHIIYDLTYQKGLRLITPAMIRPMPVVAFYYLRPDISKGITTHSTPNEFYKHQTHYLRPDISKGITTFNFPSVRLFRSSLLSTTWHIKRDYDATSCISSSTERSRLLSTTWHIKRDYDSKGKLQALSSPPSSSNYLRPDISKGITTNIWSFFRFTINPLNYLRPDISKGITTTQCHYVQEFHGWWAYYLRPDISKGITTNIFFRSRY